MARFIKRNKSLYIELQDLLKEEKSEIKRRAVFNIVREDFSANAYRYYIYAIK